ncbi:hypothetical protein Tco_0213189 [Tanacetum coccineum]
MVVPLTKVGDEAVHKELGDRMERAATTASSLEAEQDSDAQTRFEAASKSPMIHLSQELTHLDVGRTFWETASASTSENEEMEITATIDGRIKTITEASIRRHLKLEDSDGISSLPNTEIFKQLALMGPKNTTWEQFSSNIATAIICLATNRTFNFSKMIFEGPIQQDEGSTVPVELHHIPTSAPSTSQPPTTSPSIQTTHDAEEPATMPHDSSQPRVQSLGSDEGSLTLNELIVLCTTLSKKVGDLQSDLKSWSVDTEILLDQEEPIELVEDLGSGKKGEKRDYIVIPEVSTAAENLVYIRTSAEKRKVKGKSIMKEDEYKSQEATRTRKGLVIKKAIRFQKRIDEEEEKGYHALQHRPRSVAEVRKNMIMYLKNQGGYKMKDFKGMIYDDIRPIFEKVWDQVHSFVPMDFWKKILRAKKSRVIRFEDMLKNFDRVDLIKLWSLVQERYNSSRHTEDKEIEPWVELKMLFEPNAENLLELQKYMHDPLKW